MPPKKPYVGIAEIQVRKVNSILPDIDINLGALDCIFLLCLLVFQVGLSNFKINAGLFELIEKIVHLHLSHQVACFDDIAFLYRNPGYKSRVAKEKFILASGHYRT